MRSPTSQAAGSHRERIRWVWCRAVGIRGGKATIGLRAVVADVASERRGP